MKQRIIYIFILIVATLSSCHYSKDELKIINKSNTKICYVNLAKDNSSGDFYQVSAGGEIEPKNFGLPIVRSSIKSKISEKTCDNILYVVYFKESERDYVYKNIKSVTKNKSFKQKKFSLTELDRINWEITFEQ
jgi:hypothetical protein